MVEQNNCTTFGMVLFSKNDLLVVLLMLFWFELLGGEGSPGHPSAIFDDVMLTKSVGNNPVMSVTTKHWISSRSCVKKTKDSIPSCWLVQISIVDYNLQSNVGFKNKCSFHLHFWISQLYLCRGIIDHYKPIALDIKCIFCKCQVLKNHSDSCEIAAEMSQGTNCGEGISTKIVSERSQFLVGRVGGN